MTHYGSVEIREWVNGAEKRRCKIVGGGNTYQAARTDSGGAFRI